MIRYQFPVVFFYGDGPEDSIITMHDATVTTKPQKDSVITATLSAMREVLTINVTITSEGFFICIPEKYFGCRIEYLEDIDVNFDILLHNGECLDYEEATAVAYALNELYKTIKVQ